MREPYILIIFSYLVSQGFVLNSSIMEGQLFNHTAQRYITLSASQVAYHL